MYRNSEYYPDPTAGAALRQLYRKEKDLNTGKQFEADWKKSMPPDAWCYRLKDSAASYYGGNESLSFSIDNICDFDVYRYPMHNYFELKTIETPSIPLEKILGRFDRDKQKYHKLKHITDMAVAAAYRGQTPILSSCARESASAGASPTSRATRITGPDTQTRPTASPAASASRVSTPAGAWVAVATMAAALAGAALKCTLNRPDG